MHDRTLLLIALAVSALGLALLLIALAALEPDARPLDDIPDGAMTRLTGEIARVTTRNGVTSIAVRVETDATLFGELPEGLAPGACVRLTGKRSTYEGRPQLVISRISTCEGNT